MYINLFPSTESIKQQDGKFFKELTDEIRDVLSSVKSVYALKARHFDNVVKIIKRYTNINFIVAFHRDGPAVLAPDLSTNSAIRQDDLFDILNDARDVLLHFSTEGSHLKGTVNLATGKVSGIFARVEAILLLSKQVFAFSNISPEEHAALILHEVGHVVTYFIYMDRTHTTNWALRQIQDKYSQISDVEQRKQFLVRLKDAAKFKDINVNKLAKESDGDAVGMVIVDAEYKKAESELGSNIYDYNNWEFLSDQYAAKQGAGRYMVTSLSKFGSRGRTFRSYAVIEALKLVTLGALGAMVTITPAIAILALAVIAGNELMDGGKIYDRPENRLQRIRNQLVERLKDQELPDIVKRQTRDDIRYIDDFVKIGKDRLNVLHTLANKFFALHEKRYGQERLQLELEKLAMNDLYVKAFDLKQLT